MARKCLNEVLEAAKAEGIDVTSKEANTILDNLESIAKRKNKNIKSQSDLDMLLKEAIEMTKNAKIIAARRRNNALRNATIHAKLINKIRTSENPYEILRGILVGSAKRHDMLSVDAQSRTVIADLQQHLLAGLEKEGLTESAIKGVHDRDVHIALHPREGQEPNVNQDALKIAKVIRRVQDYSLGRKNRAGAYIGRLENYITRQAHDGKLMSDAGFEKWLNDIRPLLDDSTFKDVPLRKDGKNAEEEFLRDVYESLVSGIHKKNDGEYTIDGKKDPITAFKGQSNLAKSLSQSRVLHFKDGEAAFKYSQNYNRRNLFETIIDGLTHDGRSIALMENLGTNPRMMIDRILEDISLQAKKNPKLARKAKGQSKAVIREFSQLDNSLNAVGISEGKFFGADFASVASGYRMIQEMALLGSATVSSITDVASKAAFLASNTERGFFNNLGRGMADVFEGFKGPERKELAIRLLVGAEGMTGNVLSRHGPEDFGPGFISKMHALFFKLNGMRYWNHAQKVGVARILAFDGAASVKKSWNNVDGQFKALLKRYDIDEQEIKLFKDVDMKAKDGREYLFPDLADDIPVKALDPYIRQKTGSLEISDAMRARARDELRTKIGSVYTDSADTAIPTPGAKERAIMNLGLPKGTVAGEAIRMVMMLKGFPITMITKGLNRQYHTSGFTGTMKMITGMSAMGYVAMSAKDILKGKEPKTIFTDDYMKSAKVITASMIQGGGMGIFGDFMFGEFNRYGQSFTKTVAGPAFGSADDVATMFAKLVRGDVPTKDAVKFAIRNTPYANLFYTRAAADYMVLHGLMESMDPGYLRRTEKRLKKDYDQEYYFPPSQYAQRF